jgi:hypothetical protein
MVTTKTKILSFDSTQPRKHFVPLLSRDVSSGRASAVSSDGGGASVSSDHASVPSPTVPSGSSPALTACDVKNQVDASFTQWFGQLENSIDQRVTAATTAAVAKAIKGFDDRTAIWTEKIFTSMDNQARKTEKCSADVES